MTENCKSKEDELYQLVATLIVRHVLKEGCENLDEIDNRLNEFATPILKGRPISKKKKAKK